LRLKATPINEASVIFSITWVLTFLAFAVFSGDLNSALQAASVATLFLVISYLLWVLTGYWWRKKTRQRRFFMNVTVSSVVAISAIWLMTSAVSASTLSPSVKSNASGYFIAVATIFYVTSVMAAALAQFLLFRPQKDKID
jgi:amino acid transporter